MIVAGWMLWAEGPTERPEWVEGVWRVEAGRVRRLATSSAEAAALAAPGEEILSGWAVPGLADVHCHIGIGADGPVDRAEQERQARAQVASGVLLVRDCGSPVDNSWVQAREDLPLLVRCGQHVARPKRYIRGLPVDVEDVADLPRVVAEQAARSDGWVKLVGDWIDRSMGADADLMPLWPRDVLVDAVAAAHDAGARVAVHAFSHRVVDDLLEAGVDDIEHGSGMDADQLDEARRRGVCVTPTLLQVELFDSFAAQAGAKYPVYAHTMERMHRTRREHAELLFSSGVTLLAGTDSGGYQDHGSMLAELRAWCAVGVPAERVVDVATWGTRAVLGADALHEGARADLVVCASDPRGDVEALADPVAVVLAGVLCAGSAAAGE